MRRLQEGISIEEALIYTGGGLKCVVGVGFSLAIQNALRIGQPYLDNVKVVYGGSGGSISALAAVAGQADVLCNRLSKVSLTGHMSISKIFSETGAFDIGGVISEYRTWGFDIGKVINSEIGLAIPVTNFDTGEVIFCTNAVLAESADFVIENEDDLWEVIKLAQTLAGLSKINTTQLGDLEPAKLADSYNSANSALMIQHAVDQVGVNLITVVDTMAHGSETNLDISSRVIGLRIPKKYYSQREDRLVINAWVDAVAEYNKVPVQKVELRPFPTSGLLKGLFRGIQSAPNLNHGIEQGSNWLNNKPGINIPNSINKYDLQPGGCLSRFSFAA